MLFFLLHPCSLSSRRVQMHLLPAQFLNLLQSVALQMSLTCPVGKFSALQYAGTTHRLILPGNSCKQRASCLERSQIVQHAVPKPGPFCLFTRVCRDRCSSIWDDAEFRLTFALLFYRIALFHSRSDHVRIMNVLLRGMVRALQIDIGPPPLLPLHEDVHKPLAFMFLPSCRCGCSLFV